MLRQSYFVSMKFLWSLFILWVLVACAPDRSGAHLLVGAPVAMAPASRPIGVLVQFNGSDSLRRLYCNELEKAEVYRFYESHPTSEDLQNAVHLHLSIQSSGEDHWGLWWHFWLWGGGPVWPLMPAESSTEIVLEAQVWQHGVMRQKIHLVEKGVFSLRHRVSYAFSQPQKDIDWMHRVLASRLVSELMRGNVSDSSGDAI